MSLLTRRAPHVVEVQNRRVELDKAKRRYWVNDGERVRHRCAVQPARDWSSAEEEVGLKGIQVLDMRVVLSKEWTGDENSYIYWEGDIYEMIGAPQHQMMSRRTSHWRITMKRIGKDPNASDG
ncbi:MAG: hypothetical protein IJO71_09180 [Microbacterium sp.]|uniref:hypothetical protein n=1 Tax=Microbacterium sp. TaxID=51671 RepID=UPI0025E04999|nr:hypothetical protein [Microbacterium sp.]MBQ9917358.1 hypothetical protein [Microbacterium sp.]